jgi:hypothetical protein
MDKTSPNFSELILTVFIASISLFCSALSNISFVLSFSFVSSWCKREIPAPLQKLSTQPLLPKHKGPSSAILT